MLHDRMTEQRYKDPVATFQLAVETRGWREIDVMERGTAALAEVSQEMGLAFDEQDLVYYTKLFCETLKRNPTSVECFDLAQSNSEHSRHWFFKVRAPRALRIMPLASGRRLLTVSPRLSFTRRAAV